MKQPPLEPDDATLKAWLKKHGLRSTRWRYAVLRALLAAPAPISHQELTDSLDDTDVDRATVYRNLIALVEAELVRRIDLGDHVWRFELAAGHPAHQPANQLPGHAADQPGTSDGDTAASESQQHPHFLCTACGQVRCLEAFGLHLASPQTASFVAAITDVVVRGLCQECT